MNTGVKIAGFTVALAATFGAAWGVGSGVTPLSVQAEPAAHGEKHARGEKKGAAAHGKDQESPPAGGLQVADGGYRLQLVTDRVEAGKKQEVAFRILDAKGGAVRKYQREHGKELHLILASRDLTTYRHLHPVRSEDGTWATDVTLPEAGDYRLFADFVPEGAEQGLTLGADLAVTGDYAPRPLPEPSRTAEVDGYTVRLDGDLRPGASRDLTLSVSKDGEPVTDLQPYLGAYGHLVALRDGDLAYLHVHPEGEPGDGTTEPGPEVSFAATAPSESAYRLFFDFRHDGKVRTAAFTVTADSAGGSESPAGTGSSDGHQH